VPHLSAQLPPESPGFPGRSVWCIRGDLSAAEDVDKAHRRWYEREYDADGKRTDETDANGMSTETDYTEDELVASTIQTPNGTGPTGIPHVTSCGERF
jgi:YD repeat-containing protein